MGYIAMLNVSAALLGFVAALSWLRAGTVKVTREQAIERRKRKAEQQGETPSLAGVSLDGWDMSATFEAQARWNARGAIFAALAATVQGVALIAQG